LLHSARWPIQDGRVFELSELVHIHFDGFRLQLTGLIIVDTPDFPTPCLLGRLQS